jgi:hypothetical protein
MDEQPDIGMTAHQFLQGPVVLIQVVVGKADSLILLG